MTPFGSKIRQLRKTKQVTQKQMAAELGVSPAYFSALEHGHRGQPGSGLIQQICAYFEMSWEASEELELLAKLSHPRVTVDTSGLSPKATELANTLAETIGDLDDQTIEWILAEIASRGPHKGPVY